MARLEISLLAFLFFSLALITPSLALGDHPAPRLPTKFLTNCSKYISPQCGQKINENLLPAHIHDAVKVNYECCSELVRMGLQCHIEFIRLGSEHRSGPQWLQTWAKAAFVWRFCLAELNPEAYAFAPAPSS